jgi:hypothetical protein
MSHVHRRTDQRHDDTSFTRPKTDRSVCTQTNLVSTCIGLGIGCIICVLFSFENISNRFKLERFYTLSGLLSHRRKTRGIQVRCIPVTAPGTGSRITGAVFETPTRGLPVMNPTNAISLKGKGSAAAGKENRGTFFRCMRFLFCWHVVHPFTKLITHVLTPGHQRLRVTF